MSFSRFGYEWDYKESNVVVLTGQTISAGSSGYSINLAIFFGDFSNFIYYITLGYNILTSLYYSTIETSFGLTIYIKQNGSNIYTWTPWFTESPPMDDQVILFSNDVAVEVVNFSEVDNSLTFDVYYNTPQDLNNIYVHNIDGNDSPNKGTLSHPFLTYEKSLATVNANGLIKILNNGADFENEIINITKSHEIQTVTRPGYFYMPTTGTIVSYHHTAVGDTSEYADRTVVDYDAIDGYGSSGSVTDVWIYGNVASTIKLEIWSSSYARVWQSSFIDINPGLNKIYLGGEITFAAYSHWGIYASSGNCPLESHTGSMIQQRIGDQSSMVGSADVNNVRLPIIAILN